MQLLALAVRVCLWLPLHVQASAELQARMQRDLIAATPVATPNLDAVDKEQAVPPAGSRLMNVGGVEWTQGNRVGLYSLFSYSGAGRITEWVCLIMKAQRI